MKSTICKLALYSFLICISLLLSSGLGELYFRYIDGFKLFSSYLIVNEKAQSPDIDVQRDLDTSTKKALEVALNNLTPPTMNKDWFWLSPPKPDRGIPSEETLRRLKEYPQDPLGAFFAWNKNYLKSSLCKGATLGSLGILKTFHYFDSVDGSIYPIYRHIPNVSLAKAFKPNSFGFRGTDIQLNKPDNVIRIAFIGGSTTINAYGMDYSYPEYIGHWLNIWAEENSLNIKFEVINAGRTGIASRSISSLFVDEVAPLEPDFTVYYEGSNQFNPMFFIDFGGKFNLNRIVTYFKERPLEYYSAILRRFYIVWDQYNGGDGSEPIKGSYTVNWPQQLDEHDPDINDPNLPLQLNIILSDLDKILMQTREQDSILVLSSFIWLVEDGMILDPKRDILIWRQLNETFWPVPYAHFHRLANFQNKAFENYAQARDIPFIDVATKFPKDPRWFNDAIHMKEDGLRLRAWITFQMLLPEIKRSIDSGKLPKPDRVDLKVHPNITSIMPKLISRQELLSQCDS